MPRAVYDAFTTGIDLRGDPQGLYGTTGNRRRGTGPAFKRFQQMDNMFITKGLTIAKRPGLRSMFASMNLVGGQKGVAALNDEVFVAVPDRQDANENLYDASPYISLEVGTLLVDAVTHQPARILAMETFDSGETPGVYLVVEYANGDTRHHYFARGELPEGGEPGDAFNTGGSGTARDVLGHALAGATNQLVLQNLNVVHAGAVFAPGHAAGSVVAQHPEPGEAFDENTNAYVWTAEDLNLADGAVAPAEPADASVFVDSSPYADHPSPLSANRVADTDAGEVQLSADNSSAAITGDGVMGEVTKPSGTDHHVFVITDTETRYFKNPDEGDELGLDGKSTATVYVAFEGADSTRVIVANIKHFAGPATYQHRPFPLPARAVYSFYWTDADFVLTTHYAPHRRPIPPPPTFSESHLSTTEDDEQKLQITGLSVTKQKRAISSASPYEAQNEVCFTHPAGLEQAGVRAVFFSRPNGDETLELQNADHTLGNSMLSERLLTPLQIRNATIRVRNTGSAGTSYSFQRFPLVQNPQGTATYTSERVHAFDMLLFLDNGNIIHRVVVLNGVV